MEKFLLGTNWKMHKTETEAIGYTKKLIELVNDYSMYQFFIIPPYTDLKEIKKLTDTSNIFLGAQNMHWQDEGAFTGEISPVMLHELGIDLIELGHSERRQYYNETDFTVNYKVLAGIKHGLKPLICIGENINEKEWGVTNETLAKQLKIALKDVNKKDVVNTLIAYEPVWAIGENGIPAKPSYAGEVHTFIRKLLTRMYDENIAKDIPILYGGSVNIDNAVSLKNQPNVDGLFIGRSAWNIETFRIIAKRITEK